MAARKPKKTIEKLEADFRFAVTEVRRYMTLAEEANKAADAAAEKYGITICLPYASRSFGSGDIADKWKGVNIDLIAELTGLFTSDDGESWSYSTC